MAVKVDAYELDISDREISGGFPVNVERLQVVRRTDSVVTGQGLVLCLVKLRPNNSINVTITAGINDVHMFNRTGGESDVIRMETNDTRAPDSTPTLGQLLSSQSLVEALGTGRSPAFAGTVIGGLPGGLSLNTQLNTGISAHSWPTDAILGTWVLWTVFFGDEYQDSFSADFGRTA